METTSVRVRLAVARLARRLRQEGGSPLSPTLQAALATIANHGPLTPSELAERERIQRPNATKIVARLEAGQLVTRTGAPADRRSSLISLSEDGRRLLAESRTRKDAYVAQRLEALTETERRTLADLLERLL